MEIPSMENLKKIRKRITRVMHTQMLTHTIADEEKIEGKARVSAPHIIPAIPPRILARPMVTIRMAMGLSPKSGRNIVLSINMPMKKRLNRVRQRATRNGMPVRMIMEKHT